MISKRGLLSLIKLLNWYRVARAADWKCLLDVRRNYPAADMVGSILIFNVLHNDLRLITVASWRSGRMYLKAADPLGMIERGG